MISRKREAKPDEGEERIRKPIHPSDSLFLDSIPFVAVGQEEVHPYIKELIDAQARHEVGFEDSCPAILPADVIVAFKRSDAPAQWPFGQNRR